jgi:acyl dehydratase
MDYQYLEDFHPGQVFESEPATVSEAEIIEFAQKYDAQPMHIDPVAAQSITGGLIASGWHTAALTMNLFITAGFYNPAPGALGLGCESLKWPRPVRPGDSLRLRLEVLTVRPSTRRPGSGVITNRFTTLNQNNDIVQQMVSSVMIAQRNA